MAGAQGHDCPERLLSGQRIEGIARISESFDFQDILEITQMIQRKCPPQDCVAIAAGRSLYAFVDLMNLLAPGSAYSVPLSYARKVSIAPLNRGGFDFNSAPLAYQRRLVSAYSLQEQHREKIYRHFDVFFPSSDILQTKRVMLMDFSATGASLIRFHEDVKNYLFARKIDVQLTVLSVGKEIPGFDHLEHWPRFPKISEALLSEAFEYWAPYGSFDIDINQPEDFHKERDEHRYFMEALRKDLSKYRRQGLLLDIVDKYLPEQAPNLRRFVLRNQ